MSSLIKEYRPSVALSPYIQSYWAGAFNVHANRQFAQSVVPNGMIELIIHLTDDHCYLTRNDSQWNNSPDFTLIGIFKETYEVRFASVVDVFGIRFFPEGLKHIFNVPPAKLGSAFQDGEDVFDQEFCDFCSRLRESNQLTEQMVLTDEFLLNHLHKNQMDYDYVQQALKIIRRANGLISQDDLMKNIYISPRQLQRAFKEQYGVTPKEYMRLARLNAVQRYMLGQSCVSLSDAAYDHGFSDQAHFNREFRHFVGKSPGAFLSDQDKYIVNPDVDTE